MIGKGFLEVRSKVGTSLFALKDLANDVALHEDYVRILDNLLASLNDPFVMVLAGEVNVGKSSFLNTLFRGEYSPTGVLPTTEKVYFFKYGDVYQESWISDTMREVRIPAELLRDFHLVDTPGTNSLYLEHQEITERIVPVADLIFFVFSATNPWGASAWEFLEKIHKRWMRNVVFVLQQCDLRQDEEIDLIKSKIQELSQERFGRNFPIFEVSAKIAQQERSAVSDLDEVSSSAPSRFGEQAFDEIRNFISSQLEGNRSRLNKIHQAITLGKKVVQQIREWPQLSPVDPKFTQVVHHEIASLIEKFQARSIEKISTPIQGATSDYQWISEDLLQFLKVRLSFFSFFKSLWWENRRWDNLDEKFTQETAKVVAPRLTQIAQILSDDLKLLRRDLQARCHELGADSTSIDYFENFSIEKTHVTPKDFQIYHPPLGDKLKETIAKARSFVRWGSTLGVLAIASSGVILWKQLPQEAWYGVAALALLMLICFVKSNAVLSEGLKPVKDLLVTHSSGVTEYFDVYVRSRVAQFYATFSQEEERIKESIRIKDHQAHDLVRRLDSIDRNFETLRHQMEGMMNKSPNVSSLKGLDESEFLPRQEPVIETLQA